MYHYSELANAVRIKNRQQDGSDPFADYSDEELAKAYQTKYPELGKQINWGMDYSGRFNRAASAPQMTLPGGRIAQAPAVGVFADPVSPESMGSRVSLPTPQVSPVRSPMGAESTAVRITAPAARPAASSPVWAEEQARRSQMAQPTLTPGEQAAKEERDLVRAHEAEYQAYMDAYKRQRAAEGNVSSDGSLRDGSFPLSREGFAQTMAGYPVSGKFWMPAAMRPQRTHKKTVWQGVGKVTEDASRALMRPVIEAIGAVAGVEPGFSDLSHASNTRRNLETRAQVDDLRKLQETKTPLSPEQQKFLEENDPGVVAGTVAAVKEIPGMVKGVLTNPEQARGFAESMTVDFLLAMVLSAGFGEALSAVKGFDKARKLRNVTKSINGRVASRALTSEQAEALTARFLQSKDGIEAVKEARELYQKRGLGALAKDFAKETAEESTMDAVAETINGQGRGENTGLVENFVSGLPLDAAPFVAKNAAKGAYRLAKEGADPGLTKSELNAVFGGNLDLTPAYRAENGLPIAPVGKQKAGSTATRPQVEALKNRPNVRAELKQLAAMARNPETAATLYRLSDEDLNINLTDEQLRAASYGGREAGSQGVRGFAQETPHYQYDKDGNGTKSARTVATIGKAGGLSTVAHETIHGIENRLRSEAYGSSPSPEAARLVDLVDDWTERAYEWGRKNGVTLPGPKELLTQAMTYRLGWDADFDESVKSLPVPDDLVQAFAERSGAPLRGNGGLRKSGAKMDDMPLPEKEVAAEAKAAEDDGMNLEGVEIPQLDEDEELPFSLDPDTRFSFAGKRAANADLGKLAEAERRLDAGEGRDAVRKATGWFRGADGKMRFEVDDSRAKLKNISWFQGEGEGNGNLPDVLDHDELFNAYPDLKYVKTKVFIAPNIEAEGAYFQPSENTIKVSARSKENAAAYLIHEIQHAIQGQEGFAKGSNREYAAIDRSRAEFEYERTGERIAQLRERSPEDPTIPELERRYEFLRGQLDGPERNFYLRSAGETEARNTQSRRDLNADQRLESAPWDTQDVKDGEQIVRFSLASEAGIPEGRADDPKAVDAARKAWAEKGVESPWFKRWFGDSKVVDEQGKPLVVYHGTASDFTEFKRTKATDKEGRRIGMGWGKNKFYFTDTPESAGVAADWAAQSKDRPGKQPSVMPVYLAIKNPIPAEDFLRMVSERTESGMDRDAAISAVDAEMSRRGVDGIVDGVSGGFAVFSPTQIKSATGNRGTFDEGDADIRFSMASDAGIPQHRAEDPATIELARKQWAEKGVESPFFKKWFRGSKVVDEKGAPLAMYHGTSGAGFNTFGTYEGNHGLMGVGSYFTSSPDVGSSYASKGRGSAPGVYKAYLNVKNPLDMDAKANPTQWREAFPGVEQYHEGGDTNESWLRAVEEMAMDEGRYASEVPGEIREGLEAMGYDGVTHMGGGRFGAKDGQAHRVVIAFQPEQIKSATGNRGTFDEGDADMRFSLKHKDPAQEDLFSGDVYDKLVTREGTNEKQKETGRSALSDLRRRIGMYRFGGREPGHTGSEGEILGVSLYKGFVARGGNALVGQTIEGPADLAAIAQVYRDPRFETLRVVYIKSGKVVGEAGYSSRLAAAAFVPDDFGMQIRSDVSRFGADGYFVMHNHPSGRAAASGADYEFTKSISKSVPGFQGHVVIDHNEWSFIDPQLVRHDSIPMDANAVDFNSEPSVPSPLLGRKIASGRDLVTLAKELQRKRGISTLVMTSNVGKTSLVASFPDKLLEEAEKSGIGRLKLLAEVRSIAGKTGSGGPRFLVLGDGYSGATFRGAKNSGAFTDIVINDEDDFFSARMLKWKPTEIYDESVKGKASRVYENGISDLTFSLSKSDPRQKILSHVTRAMRENGLKPMAQNDMSSEWRTFSKKAKSDPIQRAKEVKAWDAVEESLRRFVADNPTIAAEAGLRPPTEGSLDEFDVQDAIDRFRVWTNSSTQGKYSAEELDHFAQASDAAQNGPESVGMGDHVMTKRSLLGMAKTHRMGGMIRFESLGEKFNAKWAPEKKAWAVTRAGGKESFEIPRDGSVWIDGEQARAPEYDEAAYPLRDDRNLRAANAEQTAMGEGDLEKSETEESHLDGLARHVQDSMRDLRKLQERVKSKDADPYREYDLAAGRGDHSGAKMREKFLRPILQLMEKHELDQNVVDSYLYARHAAERNKTISGKNPELQDGGSGMKTKDAEEILQNFAQDAVRNQALETIGKISDKLNEWRLDMQVKAGLLSEVDAKAMQAAWKHYVPLRGVPGDDDARPGVFRGKVAKQDKKKAMGRKSKAESVLAQNFAVTLDAIVNAQRNIAARELWKMAGANPDPKYWELDPSYVRNVQGKDGRVTQMADLQRMQKAPGIVPVFIKGEPHYIEFKTPEGGRIAAAIKELNQEQSNTLIRGLGKVNRFVGSMITQYSPEFVLTNFSRDYLTALTVAYARDGGKIARRMVTQAPAAVVGLARAEMGVKNDWSDWKERWEEAGGKVGFMQSKDFKSLADDIEYDLKDLSRSNYNPKKWANVVGKVVESANGSVESATRLAYFRALVENGVDEKIAAQKSKELTVNFNRRGDWKWANQFWMFFNASVQGSANIAKLFTDKDPDVRKRAYAAAGAIASAGAAVALYNQFLGGEDEDSGKTHYERLPGWAKNNAAVLLNPKAKDGSALTIPLPYGLNVIWNTGRMMAEGASRRDGFTAMDAASEIAGSIVGSFSPFGADIDPSNVPGTVLGLATPTAAKPWMELALNKNFAGRPVMPENIPGMVEKPESELYFQGVNPYARELAAFMNAETGGDKWHAGGVSVSPEKMEHVFNAYTGGVGRILQQGLGIAKTWGEGNETSIRQWPFARRFFATAPEGVDRSAFMAEVLNPAKQDLQQMKDMAKSEDPGVDKFVDEHYANVVASAAFGGLKTKEKRLRFAESLGEQIGTSGAKDEYRSFFAKAWKAKREMDAMQDEHNATTDQAKRAELRKRIEKEAEKAFEGFGK